MSTEKPYELVHVPPRLHADFDGKVTGTGDSDEKREQNFLSRALAAYAIHRLTGCSLVDAAAALVDGGGDGGIDAIYYSPSSNTLWVVQSKYIADGRGHRMTVYRKQRDGRWLLSRDVHTLSAVA